MFSPQKMPKGRRFHTLFTWFSPGVSFGISFCVPFCASQSSRIQAQRYSMNFFAAVESRFRSRQAMPRSRQPAGSSGTALMRRSKPRSIISDIRLVPNPCSTIAITAWSSLSTKIAFGLMRFWLRIAVIGSSTLAALKI